MRKIKLKFESYELTRTILVRGLAFIAMFGFLILAFQGPGLLGSGGLTPVSQYLARSGLSFFDAPSLFWLTGASDRMIQVVAWVGVGLSVLILLGLVSRGGTVVAGLGWALLWVMYLSFVNVGQHWYAFGWEMLILEAMVLATFLGGRNSQAPGLMIVLFRWLLFRLMVGAGLIKIRNDGCWLDLTCMYYHYETQPLPGPLSWFFHQLPAWVDQAGVVFNHIVELIAPFFFFGPRKARLAAGVLSILLQVMLLMSGNFTWLNALTVVLSFACFDDRFLRRWQFSKPETQDVAPIKRIHRWSILVVVGLTLGLSVQPVLNLISREQTMNRSYNSVHFVNTYGAFGSITKDRREIVVSGTLDSVISPQTQWFEYEFKAKPGEPSHQPPQVTPYHYKLDWQMWFAAFREYAADEWFIQLMGRLLEGGEEVLGLMQFNPFPARPPNFIKADLYRYRFTTSDERRQSGRWWDRTYLKPYLPPVHLDGSRLVRADTGSNQAP